MTSPSEYNYGSSKIACVRSTIAMEPGSPGEPYVEVPANVVRKQSMLSVGAIPEATRVSGGRVFSVDQGSPTRPARFLCTRNASMLLQRTLETTTDGVTFQTLANCLTTSPMAELLVLYPKMILCAAMTSGDRLFLALMNMEAAPAIDEPIMVGFIANWNGSAWVWSPTSKLWSLTAGCAVGGFDTYGDRFVIGEYVSSAFSIRSAWLSEDAGENWVRVWSNSTSPKVNQHVHGIAIDRDNPDVLWVSCGDGKGSCIVRLDRPAGWNGSDPWDAIVMEAATELVSPAGDITVSDEADAGTILMQSATPIYAIVPGEWVDVAWTGGSRLSVLVLTRSHTAGSGTQTEFTFSGGDGTMLPAVPPSVACTVNAWQTLHGAQASQGCVVNGRYYVGREGDGMDDAKRGSIWSMAGTRPYHGNRHHMTVPCYMNETWGPFDYVYNRSPAAGGGFSVSAIRHFGGLFMAGCMLYAEPSTSYPQSQGLYISDDGDTWVALWRDDTVWGIQHIAGICNGKIGFVFALAGGDYDFAFVSVPNVKRVDALIQEGSAGNQMDADSTDSPDSFESTAVPPSTDPADYKWTELTGGESAHIAVGGDESVLGDRSIHCALDADDDHFYQNRKSPNFGTGPGGPPANYCVSTLIHAKASPDCPSYFGVKLATHDDLGGGHGHCLGQTHQEFHPGERWARSIHTYKTYNGTSLEQFWALQWKRLAGATNLDGTVLHVDGIMVAFSSTRWYSYSMTPFPCGGAAAGVRGNELIDVNVGTLGSEWTVMFDWWPLEGVENLLSGTLAILTIYDKSNTKGLTFRAKATDRTLEVYGGTSGVGLLTFTGSATRWRHHDLVKIALTYTVAGGLRLHLWSPMAAEAFRHIAQTVSTELTMIAAPDSLRPGQTIAGTGGGFGRYANMRTWKSALSDADVETWMETIDSGLSGGAKCSPTDRWFRRGRRGVPSAARRGGFGGR